MIAGFVFVNCVAAIVCDRMSWDWKAVFIYWLLAQIGEADFLESFARPTHHTESHLKSYSTERIDPRSLVVPLLFQSTYEAIAMAHLLTPISKSCK